MNARSKCTALVTLVLLCPMALASEAPESPDVVVAQGVRGAAVLVTWTPSVEAVDAYRVYGGAADGALDLLVTVGPEITSFLTSSDYAFYAVSSVKLDAEAPATNSISQPCFQLVVDVPPAWAHNIPTCLEGVADTDRVGAALGLP